MGPFPLNHFPLSDSLCQALTQPGPTFVLHFPFQADCKYLQTPFLPLPIPHVLMENVLWMQVNCLPPNNAESNLVGPRQAHLGHPPSLGRHRLKPALATERLFYTRA